MSIPCTLARRAEQMDPSPIRRAQEMGKRPGVTRLAGTVQAVVMVKTVEGA